MNENMSAKKVIVSTKVPEESQDSGYLSGPMESSDSGLLSGSIESSDSGLLSGPIDTDKPQTSTRSPADKSVKSEQEYLDSGCLVSGPLSEDLSGEVTQIEDPVVVELKEDLRKCAIGDNVPTIVEQSPTIAEHLQIPIAKMFQQDDDGDTVVHITAVHGCKMRMALLIKLCPDPSWLDITNDYGHTALHLAVMSGHAVIARMLVNAGASLAVRDYTGETALHTAVKAGNRDCLLALLDPSTSGRQTVRSAVFNQTNYNGQACVHIAAWRGDVDILQTLVYYGADINVKDGCAGWTALHIAARAGDEAVSRYLLERCPSTHRYTCDFAGRTALRHARRTTLYKYYLGVYKGDEESESEDDDSDGDALIETLQSARPLVTV